MKRTPCRFLSWLALLGGFLLWAGAERAGAQSYQFTVAKSGFFIQTNAVGPVLDDDDPFVFVTQVHSDDPLFIFSTVTVTPPGRTAVTLNPADLESSRYDQPFAAKDALDAAFPDGTYVAHVDDLFGGTTELQIALSGDHYPTAPLILNYRDAQAISAAGDFALEWPPLTGQTLQDTVALLVVSNRSTKVFEGTATTVPPPTSLLIPANTLRTDNTNFVAVVDFHRNSAYLLQPNGNDAAAFFVSITQLRLQASSAPYLRLFRGPNGQVGFRFNAIPGRQYRIDSASSLPNWQTTSSPFTATHPYEEFSDSPLATRLFYRVALLPP